MLRSCRESLSAAAAEARWKLSTTKSAGTSVSFSPVTKMVGHYVRIAVNNGEITPSRYRNLPKAGNENVEKPICGIKEVRRNIQSEHVLGTSSLQKYLYGESSATSPSWDTSGSDFMYRAIAIPSSLSLNGHRATINKWINTISWNYIYLRS